MDRKTAEIVASLTLEGHVDKAQEILAAEGVEITAVGKGHGKGIVRSGPRSGRMPKYDNPAEEIFAKLMELRRLAKDFDSAWSPENRRIKTDSQALLEHISNALDCATRLSELA